MKTSLTAIGILALSGFPLELAAQEAAAEQSSEENRIVITADRFIMPALRGIKPERSLDESDVESYGSATVGEFLDEIKAQNGDEDPVFLVDGERVAGIEDIEDLPAEAIDALEVLPRGSSQMAGGVPNRRVYNIVLKKQLRSAVVTSSARFATEGGWAEGRGEIALTRIAGRDRLNAALRYRDSDALLESDRDLAQPALARDLPIFGLTDTADIAAARTLKPDSHVIEASLAGANRLAPWLSASFNLRGRWSRDDSLNGLANALFTDAGGEILRAYSRTPLEQSFAFDSASGNLVLNADVGRWLISLAGQRNRSARSFEADFAPAGIAAGPRLPAGVDPAVEPLDAFFAITTGRSNSRGATDGVRLNALGPLLALPAGDARVRGALEFRRDTQTSVSDFGAGRRLRDVSRRTRGGEVGVDIPIASARQDVLSGLGELNMSFDYARSDVEGAGVLDRITIGTLWQPIAPLSITASFERANLPVPVEVLGDPLTITPNIRIVDLPTGQTVDVDFLSGGNAGLRSATHETRRFAINASPWPEIGLNVFADYRGETLRDTIGFVSSASLPFYTAFADRFVRDGAGLLIAVDGRPVNFARQEREELRWGASFLLPIGGSETASPSNSADDAGSDSYIAIPPGAGTRLQFVLAHTLALRDRVFLSDAASPIDLLEGGAIGLGGGRPRHILDASAALSARGQGIRMATQWRSASRLITGNSAQDRLDFGGLATVNVRAFTDLDRILQPSGFTKGARVSLSIINVANDRQIVSDDDGVTPLAYQKAYRDPIGRIVEIELRKAF